MVDIVDLGVEFPYPVGYEERSCPALHLIGARANRLPEPEDAGFDVTLVVAVRKILSEDSTVTKSKNMVVLTDNPEVCRSLST